MIDDWLAHTLLLSCHEIPPTARNPSMARSNSVRTSNVTRILHISYFIMSHSVLSLPVNRDTQNDVQITVRSEARQNSQHFIDSESLFIKSHSDTYPS
jgi:hypothetical protein